MTPIDWIPVYKQWLRDRPVLDRIDFPQPNRFPGQTHYFEYNGPMARVDRSTYLG